MQIVLDFSVGVSILLAVILAVVEFSGPVIAERRDGGTPWHAHHIAERYSLFAIIALGEGIVGTVATLSAIVEEQGWNLDAALVCIAGVGLTFGIWWIYYLLPSAQILHAHRDRCFVWGYGQIAIIAAIVATGAGLHVAAYFIEGKAVIGPLATVLSVAVPVSVFLGAVYALYHYLLRQFDRRHIGLLATTAVVMALAIGAAAAGIDMAICLVIVMLAPAVTVIGYETFGHSHQEAALAQQERRATLH